ncbi:MAG: proline--tRNA ligase [Patescibacteria group bacterium]|nr:proline--tRNA ligase [Patescibacteria group bacterium]
MKYSQLFGKPTKDTSKDATLISHQLLVKGGFIRESVAGRYFMLPLGMRVQNKIVDIIRREMDSVGAQEMISPVLHPIELWQETNRQNAGNFGLMTLADRRGAKFALGGTAEEMFVDVVRKFQLSYKDLPFNIYQFSQKFRDELRARGGLLRAREFLMKDAYSFDTDAQTFKKTYGQMADAYFKIFEKLGLKTKQVLADNGYIGGEYCHEFIVDSNVGESRYLETADDSYCAHEDVAEVKLEPINPDEKPLPMEVRDLPTDVTNMAKLATHFKQPKWRFLKNVVYKRQDTGQIVIATIRGDLTVNKTKLEKAIDAIELLDEATPEDLKTLDTKPGFVHSWGHQALYVADLSLKTVINFYGGQKTETTDTFNVNYGRDFKTEVEADIALAQAGHTNHQGKKLTEVKGIEVGNIFQLGTHYSSKMKGATYQAEDGQLKPYYMGCYGIGIGRTLATIVEKYHDEHGIIWPKSVAPFAVQLISLPGGEESAEQLYDQLIKQGTEVLWDDRDEPAGKKFAVADLIGAPVRLVVSQKTQDAVEWKARTSQKSQVLSKKEVLTKLLPQKVQ